MVVIITIFIILSINTKALDYQVQVNAPSQVSEYEGDTITNKFSATITNTATNCDISCDWFTSMATQGSDVKVTKNGGQNQFPFDVKALGNSGSASFTLTIICDRITSIICWSSTDQRNFGPYSFNFKYNGDGTCTTEREKCAAYTTYLAAPNDCKCGTDKQCNPTSPRGSDNIGCATFCGNKIIESQYENCNNCPGDIGKCDGASCLINTECEGKYCVHNICSHLPYITGDNFCDVNVGENCKNSAIDCACGNNERCSSLAICETYCGNGICEEKEKGICKEDCIWCGDGICQQDESCSSCSDDCGICKKPTKEDELKRNIDTETSSGKNLEQNQSNIIDKIFVNLKQNKMPYILGGVIIIILIISAVITILHKRKTKHDGKKGKESYRCPNCHKRVVNKDQKFCNNCGHKIIEK